MVKEEWTAIIQHAEDDDLLWIQENYPDIFFRYKRNILDIRNNARRDTNMDLDNNGLKDHFLWLWGPTGSGKSHTSRELAKKIAPDEEPYLKDWNKWWNGYEHQKVTIIDEASPERLQHLTDFLKNGLTNGHSLQKSRGQLQCNSSRIHHYYKQLHNGRMYS